MLFDQWASENGIVQDCLQSLPVHIQFSIYLIVNANATGFQTPEQFCSLQNAHNLLNSFMVIAHILFLRKSFPLQQKRMILQWKESCCIVSSFVVWPASLWERVPPRIVFNSTIFSCPPSGIPSPSSPFYLFDPCFLRMFQFLCTACKALFLQSLRAKSPPSPLCACPFCLFVCVRCVCERTPRLQQAAISHTHN